LGKSWVNILEALRKSWVIFWRLKGLQQLEAIFPLPAEICSLHQYIFFPNGLDAWTT